MIGSIPGVIRFKELLSWLARAEKRYLRDKIAGTMHVLMFWGFLMLGTDMFDLATANFFSNNIIPNLLVGPWNGIVELGYTSALIGAVAALTTTSCFYSRES